MSELKFNPWVNNTNNSTARTDYLNSKGPGYLDPKAGIGNVTVSSLSSSTAWKVYRKSNQQAGDMFMGRRADTGQLYEEFGPGTPNDAIYKQRTFNLVSKISRAEDIWNTRGYFIVTGRELWGLINFGYKPVRKGGGISFVCEDNVKRSKPFKCKTSKLETGQIVISL